MVSHPRRKHKNPKHLISSEARKSPPPSVLGCALRQQDGHDTQLSAFKITVCSQIIPLFSFCRTFCIKTRVR